jgi:fibronectin-binding autotransporter adhesin
MGLTANGGLTLSNTVVARSGSSGVRTIESTNTTGTNTLSGGLFLDAGLTVAQSGAGTLSLTGNSDVKQQTLTFNSAGSTTVSGLLDSSFGAGGVLIKSGSGTLTLSNAGNRYTGTNTGTLNAGGTQIQAGTLAIGSDTALGLAPSGAYNNIQFTGTGTLRSNATISLNSNRNVSIASAQTATFDNNGNTFTVNGIVNGTGGNLSSAGSGTTVLTGVNTYTGTTTISAGTLQVGNGGGTGSLGSGSVTNNAALAIVRNNTITLANDISGTGSLTQGGSGTTILTGANSYGTTTISAGTLQVGNGGTTGSLGTGSVTNNATLAFNRTDNFVLSNAIGGTGAVQQNGSNIISINSANSYSGTTTINSGVLRISANEALGTGSGGTVVNSGGQLCLAGVSYTTAEALTLNGNGDGNGALYSIIGTNSYAGLITAASNSTIRNNSSSSLDLNGGLVKDGTTLTLAGTGTININTTGISGSAANSDLIVDAATVVVNAASNYNGPTTVQNNGTLVANAAIDTTTLTVNAGSTLAGSASVNAGAGNVYLNGTFVAGSASGGAPREDFAITAASTIAGNSSTLTFDLFQRGGDLTGTASAADTLLVTGNLSLLSSVVLDIVNAAGLSGWAAGDKWNLWDVTGSTTGTIATVNAPSLGNPLLSWQFTESTGVLEIIAVPEPSKALFTGLGLASLLFRRRRA